MKLYEPIIGLEIHLETKTKTKMFSDAPINFDAGPNTMVTSLDLGEPGSLPTVNKQAVAKAIQMCSALHMEIDPVLRFDRKNYFYADLPKGFQITQQEFPIGKGGYVIIYSEDGEPMHIDLERLHMEEDTAKQIHFADYTLLDFNRAGTPLVEIVTKPVIRSGYQAMKYVEKIRAIAQYLDISDGKMEEGSLRCDVNISLREVGVEKFGTKVEIKNLNSIANVRKAIEFEIERQTEILNNGELVAQETRRFDEGKRSTILMRLKTDAVDYKYFREGNILPIKLSTAFIIKTINTTAETPDMKYGRYTNVYKLSHLEAVKLIENQEMALFFDSIANLTEYYQIASNFIKGEVSAYINSNEISFDTLPISKDSLACIIDLIGSGRINNKTAREIFAKALTGENPYTLYEETLKDCLSPEELEITIKETLDSNQQSVEDYKNGRDRAFGFLVGQIMKKTQGKADPQLTNQILKTELAKR